MTEKLTRETVTVASRIMLPAYAIAFAAVGLLFIFQAASRTSAPVFDVPKLLLPMGGWGVMFLAVACVETFSLVLNRRSLYLRCLIIGSGFTAFWSVVIAASAFRSEFVSFTSAVFVALCAVAQVASARSVARGEV